MSRTHENAIPRWRRWAGPLAIVLCAAARSAAVAAGPVPVPIAPRQAVPVLARTDVLIVGSSLDACFLAQRVASGGRRVILAPAGTSLPRDVAMALRPWVSRDRLAKAPEDVRSFLAACKKGEAGDEIILDMIKLTEGLEDRILDKGVGLYYDVQPCGVQTAGRRVAAVLFACKGGLAAIEAGTVVDCTPDASLAALAGADTVRRPSANQGVVVRYSMLCRNAPRVGVLTVKGVGELVDGRVLMHGEFAEFRLRLPASCGPFDGSVRSLEARRLAVRAATELSQSDVLEGAAFVRGGDALLADPVRRIVSRSTRGELSVDACRPKGIDNLLVCGSAADVGDAVAATLVEPLSGRSLVDVLAAAPWDVLGKGRSAEAAAVRLSRAPVGPGRVAEAQATFTELSPIYRTDAAIPLDGTRLPVVASCDVLVVGAGTSGLPAALVAAERGADTLVVEKYGDVGGTHTIGGVSKYWYGRKTRFFQRLDSAAAEVMRKTHMPKCMGQLSMLMGSGVRLLTHSTAVGAVVEGRTVVGIVVVTPQGLAAIRAKRIIDATGDGDIAVRAGSDMTYGTRRDAMTLWYSFAQYAGTNPQARRHFAYVVDPRDPTDMTRAIIAGRRFKRGRVTAPQYYLTPRETRHIRGGWRVTVADILAERRFEDLILIGRANFDIKGIADSDLSFSGYVEWQRLTNYSVQIPYRAIRPRDLENILVVGKAYSVSHDALSLARMQRDMMAMGAAAGVAADQAVRENASFSDIDVKAMQKELVKLGVLSEDDLGTVEGVRDNALPPMSEGDLRKSIDQLAAGQLRLDGQVQILARPEAAVPLLKEALPKADRRGKVELARALCYLGAASASQILLDELARLLAPDALPGLTRLPTKRMAHPLPDHGFAPDATYLVNTLARLGDKRIIPFMTRIAAKVEAETGDAGPMFSYVFSVCYAAERLADPACVEALAIVAAKPGLSGGLLPRGTDPRRTARGLKSRRDDRYAYLELCIGRAMARCGARAGYETLLAALGDIRGFIARSAHDELAALTGLDLGYDAGAWRARLRSVKIAPKAYGDDAP